MFRVAQKLKLCRHAIVDWQRNGDGNLVRRIANIQQRLETCRNRGLLADKEEILELEKELLEAYQLEERFWHEKSRVKWLRWGDRNTKFFHSKVRTRNRANKIWGLEDSNGVRCSKTEEIAAIAEDYFKELFKTNSPSDPADCFNGMQSKVTSSMNQWLTRRVSNSEIKRATFSINPDGAPGEDGFTAKFCQHFWNIVSQDIYDAVRSFNGSRILKSLNHTHLCLIPKVDDARNMSQVRPISLCTILYKVI